MSSLGGFGAFSRIAIPNEDGSTAPAHLKFDDGGDSNIDFESTWKQAKSYATFETQTDPVRLPEKKVGTGDRIEKHTQTVDNKEEAKFVVDTSPAFIDFLKEQTPIMEEQLEKNLQSRAFGQYTVSWEEEINSISCAYELSPSPNFNAAASEDSVSGLTWNASGSMLVASYGKLDHAGWCSHVGSLKGWNVFRRKMDPKKPEVSIETPNCLMCAEFHPEEVSIIAGGTFNGQLLVWDLDNTDEPLLAATEFTEDNHLEPISKIVWLPGSTRKSSKILTIGGDGKVLCWGLIQKLDTSWKLDLIQGYLLSIRNKGVLTGGTALSLNSEDPNTFVVGTEPGRIYKCALNDRHNREVTADEPRFHFANPINFSYDTHTGPVNHVHFSPFHRNIFLSCACDSQIRIYHMLKQKCALTLLPSPTHYVYCCTWSPFRPLVFAAGSGDGRMYIYDLQKSRVRATATIDAGTLKAAVIAVSFNAKRRDYIATGDAKGVVRVWQLNHFLSRERPQEMALLSVLGGAEKKQGKTEEKE
ncbi:hypothetical protein PROFUN_07798 [Planoprotostelium fungivorum]|uniref:Uncharacterized protein n=1 Tax=Planoprotostelium fungivorum TaxID=1890364 RepID=A0A2P6MX94_9EUKA|nr:hypothetical protein PROFUN_07798 [Planoprotostelium fungivorum]